MATEARSRGPRWRSGLGRSGWAEDEREYAVLLDALTRDRLHEEGIERERHATARRSLADVQEEQLGAVRAELGEARRELHQFRTALDDARARSGPQGQAEVSYDSADPLQDAQADLLIQYLVRAGHADVRTEERRSGRYVYWIQVHWDELRQLVQDDA
jgi:hypothetical protein